MTRLALAALLACFGTSAAPVAAQRATRTGPNWSETLRQLKPIPGRSLRRLLPGRIAQSGAPYPGPRTTEKFDRNGKYVLERYIPDGVIAGHQSVETGTYTIRSDGYCREINRSRACFILMMGASGVLFRVDASLQRTGLSADLSVPPRRLSLSRSM